MASSIKPWERIGSKILSDCRIFTLNESAAISPVTGKEHAFYFLETGDWVNLVPITEDDELVCIRQFRHGSETITLEIPGGMVDLGEDPAVAAARECLEETGYACGEVTSLGVLNPNPALFGNRLHTYVATGVYKAGEIANTTTEETVVELVPMTRVPELLMSGEIDHALVAATLWRLLCLRETGSL